MPERLSEERMGERDAASQEHIGNVANGTARTQELAVPGGWVLEAHAEIRRLRALAKEAMEKAYDGPIWNILRQIAQEEP